jgi:tRNA threonylcarbamoyladenosine biosynthesis protein TsaE
MLACGSKKLKKIASAEEMILFGRSFKDFIKPRTILALCGTLGSGKTTFLKGLISSLTGCDLKEVTSPTFTVMHKYDCTVPVYHFDLYRLKTSREFQELGFDEHFSEDAICCIEWAERIELILPPQTLCLSFEHAEDSSRVVTYE